MRLFSLTRFGWSRPPDFVRHVPLAILVVAMLGLARATPATETGIRRQEVGRPIPDLVALINSTSPADDVFNAQFCGGLLVAEDVVLTAAHCVANTVPGRVDVIVGADNLCRDRPIDGVRVGVARIEVDHRYDRLSGRFDIAHVVIEQRQDVSRRPITKMPRGDASHPAIAIGWGRASTSGVPSCRATHVALTLLSPVECARQVPSDGRRFDPSSMLCAVPNGDARLDTCEGDSGGPMFLGGSLEESPIAGVVSWGRGCGNGVPGIYARADVAFATRAAPAMDLSDNPVASARARAGSWRRPTRGQAAVNVPRDSRKARRQRSEASTLLNV